MNRKGNNAGFSLIELMIVLVIMAILVIVLAPTLMRYVEKARVSNDISALSEVENAINLAALDQTVYRKISAASGTGKKGLSITIKMGADGKYYLKTLAGEGDQKGNALEDEVAKTIPKVSLVSAGLREAEVTFTAKDVKGTVQVTMSVPKSDVTGEAVAPFIEAFGEEALKAGK